jgi:hypothetical protein
MRQETVKRLRKYAQRERRSVSNVVEIAVDRLLDQIAPAATRIMTSRGRFTDVFSRGDAYEGR